MYESMRLRSFVVPVTAVFLAFIPRGPVTAQTQPSRAAAAPPVASRTAVTTATASRASAAPVIDGSDSDAAWASAQPITDFRTFEPVDDGDPRFRTEARVLNDAENLYVLIRAFDPHPDSIIGLLSRRDVKTQSDQLKIMVD